MRDIGNLQQHQQDFLEHLAQAGYSAISLRRHRFAATEFAKFTKSDRAEFSRQEIVIGRFMAWRTKRRKRTRVRRAPTYTTEYARAFFETPLRKYFEFLAARGVIPPQAREARPQTLLDEVLTPYLELCRAERGREARSVKLAERTLLRFSLLLDAEGVRSIASIHIGHVDLYGERRGGGRATTLTENSILRRFLRWLYLEGKIGADISRLVLSPRTYALSKVPSFLSESDLRGLLAFKGDGVADNLVRAMIELLLFTGLRMGEAATLELGDIDWQKGLAIIRNRKNGRDLLVPLPPRVTSSLRYYIEHARPDISSPKVFLTLRAPLRPASPGGLSIMVARYFQRRGVHGGAHRLRHTFAQRLLDSGSSLQEVQSLLGQESIQSTRIYAKASMQRMRRYVVGEA